MSKDKKQTLLLVDGNSLAHRCIYAHKDLGFWADEKLFVYTGMAYGFLKSMEMMNKKLNPDAVIVVWDGGHAFRTAIYPQYKQRRRESRLREREDIKKLVKDQKAEAMKDPTAKPQKPPHDFRKEIRDLWSIMRHLGIQQYHTINEEADDLIGTLCYKLRDTYRIIISSNDYDFQQLLHDDMILYRSGSNGKQPEYITEASFRKQYGFHPKFYVNVLAIGGDATDEYPGISGISEETAFELVAKYGPKLEKIISKAEAGEITNTRATNLINEKKDDARLCKKLAKIRIEAPLTPKPALFDIEKLKNDFKALRFHSLLYADDLAKIEAIRKPHVTIPGETVGK